ncbi:chloride channel protein [Caproicibacterium sp. BJN0003]|uniref:chloride channel protein n=1 Tax=Caproicibacterium sp. BJN0003 TaxID=2994078 RepID=UPI0022596C4F|nr:chloride channel protein [Caproicibacterium sp. BJN0003]UZT82341.1 chloride channel protein [Caproicibacterium sp. BJN0003]
MRIREEHKEYLKEKTHHVKEYMGIFFRWVFLSVIIGVFIGGLVGTLFYYALEWCTDTRSTHEWLLYFLPLGGLLIVWLYRSCGVEKSRGTNLILLSIREKEPLPAKMAPLIFISTSITHLFGGSAGREGAALQIGGSLGYRLGRLMKLDENALHVVTMCGMGSVFSALFGMPVVAAVFALEITSVGVMYYSALVPVCISCLLASGIAESFGAIPTHFVLNASEEGISLLPALQIAVLAGLCALVAILFCRTLRLFGKLYQRFFPNPYIRVAVGGVLVILVTLLTGVHDYEGAGGDIIERAIGGEARPEAFLLKIILTGLTLGAGFKGGEIVPSFYIGATFGCWMGGLLGIDPGIGAAVGLVCLFCGVVNCPITALFLSCSLFGYDTAPYFFLACAISYMLSGYTGLYSEQTILYGKFHAKFINKKAE